MYGTKKSKGRREEPLGTMSYQTSSKRSPPFCLLIGARKLVFFWHQSEARTAATVGTGLVRHCPQGLFSPFFTFLRAIFFRPFRLSLAPTICPWVSEDVKASVLNVNIVVGHFKFEQKFSRRKAKIRKKLRHFRFPPNLAHTKLIDLANYVPSSSPHRVLSFT